MSTYGETPSTLHPPHHGIRATHVYICLYTSPEIHRYDIRIPICAMATDGSASAASEIEAGSINPTMQELRAAAAKQADTCVAGVAWCGMLRVEGLPVRRHSYRGHRVELWMIADRLKCSKRQLNVKQNRQLGCTWALCGTNRHSVFQTNGRARGLGFLLDFSMYMFLAPNGQGTPVFGRCPK